MKINNDGGKASNIDTPEDVKYFILQWKNIRKVYLMDG